MGSLLRRRLAGGCAAGWREVVQLAAIRESVALCRSVWQTTMARILLFAGDFVEDYEVGRQGAHPCGPQLNTGVAGH